MNIEHPLERWLDACEEAKQWVIEADFESRGKVSIEAAYRLLFLAYEMAGTSLFGMDSKQLA